MSRVFWDTNLFIYLLEASDARGKRVGGLAQRMLERGDQLFTSALTLGEILVKPIEKKSPALADAYEELLSTRAVVIPFERRAARIYAGIRQDRAIKPPDAIQLSCAAAAGVDLFITNDDRLSKKIVTGIQFIISFDRVFL